MLTRKRLFSVILLLIFTLTLLPVTAAAASPNVYTHTPGELAAHLLQNPASATDLVTYTQDPVCSAPYDLGAVSQSSLDSATRMLNNIRFIAGLDPVVYDPSQSASQQAACMMGVGNGPISHTPSQPKGMSDALYQMGYAACQSSNLSAGYNSLNHSLLSAWLSDYDDYNLPMLGHRRWCLNPQLGKVGFGAITNCTTGYKRYFSMSCLDSSNTDATQTCVVWPAQVTPLAYFSSSRVSTRIDRVIHPGDPWSIATGSAIAHPEQVSVQLVCNNTGEVWNFSSAHADGYFNVSNEYYGTPGCIIFRPELGVYHDGDVYTVTVSGLSSPLSYQVRFVDLSNPFTDVAQGRFFTPAVMWAYFDGIASGTTDTTFSPDEPCTRADMVTYIWRAAGSPKVSTTVNFEDVSASDYFYDAVCWAYATGVTKGITDTQFAPNASVTRGQAVTFLYRSKGCRGTYQNSFEDVRSNSFCANAVGWAYENGITVGTSATQFSPNNTCTRGHIITFLYRCHVE